MELNEVLAGIGIDLGTKKIEDLKVEDIKALHSEKFIGVGIAHDNQAIRDKVIGSMKGGLETKIKRGFKELGVEFEASDNLDSMIDGDTSGFKKLSTNITEIKENASKGNDEKLTKLQGQFDTLSSDHATIKDIKTQLEKDLKVKDKDLKNAESNFQIKTIADKSLDATLISNDFIADKDIRDTAIEGFNVKFNNKYKWELDDSTESPDGLKLTHAVGESKGTRVTIENKFASLNELWKRDLKASKMLKLDDNINKERTPFTPPKDENGKPVLLKSAGMVEKLQEAIDKNKS